MNPAIPQASLQIVGDELGVTLNDARVLLEQYAEGDGGAQALERVAALLHTVRGVLRMTETYGASLLAEEMEQTCAHLVRLKRHDAGADEPIEALMRAAVQLPAYVERVMNGGRDVPLVLLPLLNDLRAARGRPLLSESTLLLLNVRGDSAPRTAAPAAERSGEDLTRLCLELRPRFQLALLGWIRGDQGDGNLRQMYAVLERLEAAAVDEPVRQLWWVAAGVIEALLDTSLDTSVSLKRLMGQVDREIKRLRTLGEAEFARTPPVDLVNNLLYYVARVRGGGGRVAAIRAAFNLSDLVPGDAQVEQARQGLSAPSVKLMQTVAQAIREDLARVKDVLDIFVRARMERAEELTPQLELLKKIGDTLGVLGLGELRESVQRRREELEELVGGGQRPAEAQLVAIAAALLEVEDRLERDLIAMISPRDEAPTVVALDRPQEGSPDLRQVTPAVMRESLVNLARVKDAVAQVTERGGEVSVLDAVPAELQGIAAGLLLLGRERAAGVVGRLQRAIATCVSAGAVADRSRLDRLADATVSLEYFLETLQAGRSDPEYMLDNAERCLSSIELSEPAAEWVPEQDHIATLASPPPGYEPTQVIGVVGKAPAAPEPTLVFSGGRERLDPELIELFIEEAREEIVGIERNFAGWERDDADGSALVSLRRAFHTLKGSGRMVGADLIGEYCWNVERLFNRLIEGTLPRTAPLLDLLSRCIGSLPGLLEQLETGATPQGDATALVAEMQAFLVAPAPIEVPEAAEAPALAGTEPDDAIAPPAPVEWAQAPEPQAAVEPVPVAAIEPASSAPAPIPDPVLFDIFTREVSGHLAVLSRFVAACDDPLRAWPVTEELYRACHTLNGSMAMARVSAGMPLTEALNQLVSYAYDRPARLPPGAVETLRDTAARLEALLTWLAEPWRPEPHTSDIEQRLHDQLDLLEHPAQVVLEDTGDQILPAVIAVEAGADPDILVEELLLPLPGDEVVPVTAVDVLLPIDEIIVPTVEPDAAPVEAVTEAPVWSAGQDAGHTPASAGAVAYDPEIAAIFAEEAAELLEAADRALGEIAAGDSARALNDLQRHLHTLKGGARMAGLTAMGDFSHELETLLIRLGERLIERTPAVDELLRASLDELHRLRDAVVSGVDHALPGGLMARLQAVLGGVDFVLPLQPEPEWQSFVDVSAPDAPVDVVDQPAEFEPAQPGSVEPEPVEPGFAEAGPADPGPIVLPAIERIRELARELERPPIASPEPAPAASPMAARPVPAERRDVARVDAALLDQMLNNAGELSIFQSRLGQQLSLIQFNLEELGATVVRLREQMRKLEVETEAQILFRHQDEKSARADFDPLELDRYSTIQQLSRSLAESATDVSSLKDLLQNMARDTEALLVQQSRTAAELQDGLMRTRMVPFQHHASRLARLVRQSAQELGKRAELQLSGTGELDRQVLERMLGPFEHMLRNAVVHGIESPEERMAAGKPPTGEIRLSLHREGTEAIVEIADDGRGVDVAAIRRKAAELQTSAVTSDEDALQLILRPGFSTADRLTQAAGRGIGMDVVANEVARLGGSLRIDSTAGRGTTFTIRLPITLAVTQALIVRVGSEIYALPVPTVEGVIRMSRDELMARLEAPRPAIEYGGQSYTLRHLGDYVGLAPGRVADGDPRVSLVLVRAAEHSTALIADEMHDSREIVVKPVGPQLATIRGIAGATILGDGRIAVILDMGILVRSLRPQTPPKTAAPEVTPRGPLALVVDDSITMRRVTARLLERNGFEVVTARDGLEAIGLLQDHRPDIILLDIEMPRMDGYEFAKHVRNNADTAAVPIVMITSRVSDKHKARAIEVGVNDYLGKPYQERALLEAVRRQLGGA